MPWGSSIKGSVGVRPASSPSYFHHVILAVGLATFFGLVMTGVGALVSHELYATGACVTSSASGTFLKLGAGIGVFAAVAIYLLGHDQGSNRLLWAAGAFLAPLFWCYGGGLLLNQALDGGPAVRYEGLLVVDKELDDGSENSQPAVIVNAPSERACEGTWQIGKMAPAAIAAVVPNETTLTVVVKPGFFGFPWVKGAAIQKEVKRK